jgi:hypothetical protein
MSEEDDPYIHRPGKTAAILLTLTRLIVQFMRRNL